MSQFRFIHTSDLHLGRRFGNLPEDVRGRLVEARHAAIGRLVAAARNHGAKHILVAGDIFDTETPSNQVWRQAIAAMSAASDIDWWVIPGNHDSLAAEALWDQIQQHAPANVHALLIAEAMEVAPCVTLLPAPASRRYPGRDLTEWMVGCDTPQDHLRIGLAHGAIQTFASEDGGAEIIPPDRATSARLDYLALGDWHGMLEVGERTFYSGSPERDRFKHSGRGVCLAVTMASPGAAPQVDAIEVGQFDWAEISPAFTPGHEELQDIEPLLPAKREQRRDVLVRFRPEGRLTMVQRTALEQALNTVKPEFCHFELDDSLLETEYAADDLDEIAVSGALRLAARELLEAAKNTAASADDRAVAGAALNRLYSYVRGNE